MVETNRILIDKNFLRKTLTEKEDVLTSLCQLIDNSIQAYDKLTYKRDNICNVKIKINKNYIIVQDNSGGIEKKVTDEEIFKNQERMCIFSNEEETPEDYLCPQDYPDMIE